MAKLIVLYKTPTDPAAFDRHYAEIHAPLASKIPGLRRYETSRGAIASPGGASPYHLVATLYFDTTADIGAAFASPEGQAAAADVQTFADGGAEMLVFDDAAI